MKKIKNEKESDKDKNRISRATTHHRRFQTNKKAEKSKIINPVDRPIIKHPESRIATHKLLHIIRCPHQASERSPLSDTLETLQTVKMITGGTTKNELKRGAFILLEGVDRCGKTTQCKILMQHLLTLSVAAVAMRFPERSTNVGQLIDGYLASGKDLDDRAVHLLFSANRWEAAPTLAQELADGKSIVCDRYAYSGVAFSSAKTKEDRQSEGEDLSVEWCKAPDVGLPAPDTVIFLDLSQEESEKRGG